MEHKWNKIKTDRKQERKMTDLLQDIVSLVCMSTFLVTMAFWIGAL